jgi:hypothetical protein
MTPREIEKALELFRAVNQWGAQYQQMAKLLEPLIPTPPSWEPVKR